MRKIISEFIKSVTGYEKDLDKKLYDASKIFDCEILVVMISSYLDD